MAEKRRFVRVDTQLTTQYRKSGSRGEFIKGSTKNLCADGVGMFLPEKFNLGDGLEIRIVHPDGEAPINANGEVVWVDEIEVFVEGRHKPIYITGIKLIHNDLQNQVRYLLLVCDLMSKMIGSHL